MNRPHHKRIISVIGFLAVWGIIQSFGIYAQNEISPNSATYTEYFNIGSHKIKESPALRNFRKDLNALMSSDSISNVYVKGYASVDGPAELNNNLALERATAMKDWLDESTDIDSDNILLNYQGEDWKWFRQLVAEDPDVPSKEKAMSIIESDATPQAKNYRLKKLSGGETWRYLAKNIFPKMRVAIVSVNYTPVVLEETKATEAVEVIEATPAMNIVEVEKVVYVENHDCLSNRVALKTNLLYDAALMPSVEFEYKFNNRWSLAIEGNIAWWSNDKKHKYYQIMTIVPEVKYHFNPGKHWQGHYLGLFIGGGKYDLENGGTGYKGEGGMLGLSYNYNWSITNNFGIEAGVGVGGMFTRYKEYIPKNGEYVYQKTKNLWYGGPLRLKVALVWKLWNNKCKGGVK